MPSVRHATVFHSFSVFHLLAHGKNNSEVLKKKTFTRTYTLHIKRINAANVTDVKEL